MNDQPPAADFIQANRILRIISPLGEDQLLPERATIAEGVSSLFEIVVSARAKRDDIKPEELIGRLVDVSLEVQQDDDGGVRRPFNGLVTELSEGPPVTRGMRSYTLVLRPQLWLLSRRSNCRIWMDKTSLDIVQELLSEHGLPTPDVSGVITPPPAQHYSVQWNETDLDYLLRRFEEDGLFFWFSHEDGSHRLQVADSPGSWAGPSPSAQGEARVRFSYGSTDRNHITSWTRRFAYVPGQRAGADWNFETPKIVPISATPSLVQMPDAIKRELYEFPARAPSMEAAERAEKLRMQSTEADHLRVSGASTVRVIEPGRRFTPYDVANPEAAFEEHVIVSIRHEVVDRSYETNADSLEYKNEFQAIPSSVPGTPHRATRRPRIEGTQVAIVAGPAGEEIHPDQYGRVKLWFPWDRYAKKDGTDTCWVRVAQNWAGGGWGGQIVPRIGMEVMVAFIDGDPDKPLIVGFVPNPDNKVPYDLPANKTKSVFRTNTHKGQGFNELSFEDEAGREEVYLHAQRDNRIHVENSRSKRIDNNQSESIGHNKTIEVGNNHHEIIGGNMTLMVGPNILQKGVTAAMGILRDKMGNLLTDKLGVFTDRLGFLSPATMGEGNMVIGVGKNKAETVMLSSTEIVGAAKALTIGGGYQVTVGGVINESIAVAAWQEVGNNKVTHVGEKYELVVGKSSLVLDRDGNITLKGVNIVVEGSSSIKMDSKKIDLN
ncbi:type VI secretion system Vgr family protein [Nitratireductor sp. ZSWI3]|uniref:type VI secretion system Vgr family protein n=1 Tax=Nitratireductor sp. ZSWI3 TaxID=2966359 RepID=UPI0021501055|nr:type VI secretion system tip protein TssI/VgrG [Nitratireductor sp. ZSWI3]MCR4266322.1 type VI secretion system tip protein VgrG [Nitratireductor sp. ZSWI3]